MNVKKLALGSALIVAVGIAVFAFAAGPLVGHGRGVAKNANNMPGRFDFEVGKRIVNGEPQPAGRFAFEAINTAEHVKVGIQLLPPPAGVGFAPNHVCEFGGRAKLVRKVGDQAPVMTEGRVEVRVQDNWNPGMGGGANHPKDGIRVRFFNANNEQIFHYEGQVFEGNIFVGERPGGGGGTTGGTSGGTTGG